MFVQRSGGPEDPAQTAYFLFATPAESYTQRAFHSADSAPTGKVSAAFVRISPSDGSFRHRQKRGIRAVFLREGCLCYAVYPVYVVVFVRHSQYLRVFVNQNGDTDLGKGQRRSRLDNGAKPGTLGPTASAARIVGIAGSLMHRSHVCAIPAAGTDNSASRYVRHCAFERFPHWWNDRSPANYCTAPAFEMDSISDVGRINSKYFRIVWRCPSGIGSDSSTVSDIF